MKYSNAAEVLPQELLLLIQNYYQGGYLYIPKKSKCPLRQPTDYRLELEKRDQHIYLMHLEGRTNGQLGNIYHLAESSIRRILSKEKVRYQKMKETIKQLLSLWGISSGQLLQIYPSAWEIDHSYVIKVYDDPRMLERNIRISEILSDCGVPVAEPVPTKTGEKYAKHQSRYFLMSKKLPGNNLSNSKDQAMARKMGYAIAQLHNAFLECEKEIDFWDNSLLKEMKGWIFQALADNEWKIISEEEYAQTTEMLEILYDRLPKQLIHRDVHFGNFLFYEGNLSGYIDFDLSQRNIRIFDICYFLTGLLAEETEDALSQNEWLEIVSSVIDGYESLIRLSAEEKDVIPCVMECIEILFAAYFINMKDTKHARDACNIFHFIQNCENKIRRCPTSAGLLTESNIVTSCKTSY